MKREAVREPAPGDVNAEAEVADVTAPAPAPAAAAAAPAPAAAAPAPAAAAGMPDWNRFIEFLEKKSIRLAGIYALAKFRSWTGNRVEVGAKEDQAHDAETVKLASKLLTECFGRPLELVVTRDVTGESVADVEGARRKEERDVRVEEARAHPATQAVIDAFGAAIKEIKVDG